MKFKVNDEVVVIAGAHKGRVAKITKIDHANNKVYLKDLNIGQNMLNQVKVKMVKLRKWKLQFMLQMFQF